MPLGGMSANGGPPRNLSTALGTAPDLFGQEKDVGSSECVTFPNHPRACECHPKPLPRRTLRIQMFFTKLVRLGMICGIGAVQPL
eukprot:631116-Amphidinium_carterae.1